MTETIAEKIREAPDKSGVYLFKDKEGNVLYVGKAKNLRNRLRSYLSSKVPHKISVMLKKAWDLEVMTTDSELNAFILENNLIKTHKPPFNVMLKDDKTYPYIRIAMKDPFPFIEITRRVQRDGSIYYGPYVPAWAVRETIKVLTQSFPIRRCKRDLTKTKQNRPCLNHQMGKCLGPCCGNVSREEYMEVVKELIELMEGRGSSIVDRLEKEMMEAADNLEFEKAAKLRDRIFSIRKIMERQKMLLEEKLDMDVIGEAAERETVCLCVIFVRKGMVVGEKPFIFDDAQVEEAIEALFREFYLEAQERPPVILTRCRSSIEWEDVLNIKVKAPWNRQTEEIVAFAREKAQEELRRHLEKKREAEELMEEAVRVLGLKRPPLRIEGYDISNLQGREATGSMVVFELGKPAKSQYRRFKIRYIQGPDDYAMHEEVMRRRLSHTEWKRPDLILIDGGPGQLKRVASVVQDAGWDVDILAISKGEDRDHIWSLKGEIELPSSHPVYHLLQRVRDESHRFALSHHRRLRSKRMLEGLLDGIEGVGPARKLKILQAISLRDEIPPAHVLAKECNIPLRIAQEVVRILGGEQCP